MNLCDGSSACLASEHIEGCFADRRRSDEQVALEVASFYDRSSWPVGTLVRSPDNRLGTIVKSGGGIWVNREKLPMVRWHGKLDAEPVPWDRLERVS